MSEGLVRLFTKLVGGGGFDTAWAISNRGMPFPAGLEDAVDARSSPRSPRDKHCKPTVKLAISVTLLRHLNTGLKNQEVRPQGC